MKTINEHIETCNLRTYEITTSRNNYPNLTNKIAVVGFDTFTDAETFVNMYGGNICQFTKRDGHHFLYNCGNIYKPFTYDDYLNKLGWDYSEYTPDIDMLKERISDIADIDMLSTYVDKYREAHEQYQLLNDDEILIMYGIDIYDTCKKTMMQYYEDVTHYYIGVEIDKNLIN